MHITFLVIELERAMFFCRGASYWTHKHSVTFLTTKYHVFRYIRRRKFTVYMLQDFINESTPIDEFEKFKDEASLMEQKANLLPPKLIDRQFNWFCKGLKKYFLKNTADKFVLWNGSMLQGYTASKITEVFNIPTLFFEIGNFPNKIFVDPQGVNAASSLMNQDISVCPDYDEKKLNDYLTEHKRRKEYAHIVLQKRLMKKINYWAIYDLFYNALSKYSFRVTDDSVFKKIFKKVITNKLKPNYDNVAYQNINYILFPLQVSIDSQVIRNSDINIREGIEYALKDAEKYNLNLIIKPHPAERNQNIYMFIHKLKQQHKNVYLTNCNTYKLIKHSEKVITINSTVGIESLMYYKPTEVLGRAFYKRYCQPDLYKTVDVNKINRFLYNYLFCILRDADYFGTDNFELPLS